MARINTGDFVLFYKSSRLSYLKKVQTDGNFECHKGRIPWAEVCTREYGDEVKTHLGIGFLLLQPSIADLMIGVKRKTTIAYPKEIGYVLLRASIFPGIKVAEVGSGSGALASILARYVQPTGHVYSFERRSEFLELAKRNMDDAGLSGFVTFELQDVARVGFGIRDMDVCAVDVPEPWTIVSHARDALKSGGRWFSLSPTTEQLQQTRKALVEFGFCRIEAKEILMREMLVRPQGSRPSERMISHTAYIMFADSAGPVGNLKEIEGNSA